MTAEREPNLKNSERQKCEIWTRIMGYFRPVSGYNPGKKAEFYERRYFSEQKALQNVKTDPDDAAAETTPSAVENEDETPPSLQS